jgi:UDP-N-acetylglucosamine 1-carboxyvinyltransferase
MDMFVVSGGRPLCGRLAVSGAKNAALPLMAAAILSDGIVTLEGVPPLVDVQTLAHLLRTLGLRVEPGLPPIVGQETPPLELEVLDSQPCVADYELVRRMRASICVLGPLLARRGRACVSLPGGCNIGDRPVDLHLKGLAALGADISVERGYIQARASRLKGAAIYLGGPFGSTVTGTCNVLSAAVLAEGVTTIEAAACEPEVVDLGRCLIAMGARIEGLGTPFLRIEGVDRLQGTRHRIIPDRIEAATLMLAAAITAGDLTIENVRLDHLTAVVEKLREMGVSLEQVESAGMTISDSFASSVVRVRRTGELRACDCVTLPYPGLPTDVQAQFMAALTMAPGLSVVTDRVFPDRFLHAPELARLGAHIRREGPTAIVAGAPRLSGANVMASDLRASAALVLAALAAEGETVIRRIYHLDRGYDRLEEKLRTVGASIERVDDQPDNVPGSLAAAAVDPESASPHHPPRGGHALGGPKWLKVRQPRQPRAGE